MTQQDDSELKALQKKWYQKLRDTGFEDIEDTESPRRLLKQWHSTYFYRHYTVDSFKDKQDYWRRCSRFLHHHRFKDKQEYIIFELYCDGLSLRQIADKLRNKKNKFNKDSINKIVSNLLEMMKAMSEAIDE